MRVPQFDRYRKFMQSAGVFLLGLIIGAVLFNSIHHYQLFELHDALAKMGIELEEKNHDLNQLKEYKDQHTVIKTVHSYIDDARSPSGQSTVLDTQTQAELKKRIKADLEIFIGRSVYDIGADAALARSLLEDKIYIGGVPHRVTGGILDKDYIISVRTMLIIGTDLTVWVQAKVHERV